MSTFESIDNPILENNSIQNTTDEKIFDIINNLFRLLIQENDLNKNDRYTAHEEFNRLLEIKEELH
jgi:hypothetical protein